MVCLAEGFEVARKVAFSWSESLSGWVRKEEKNGRGGEWDGQEMEKGWGGEEEGSDLDYYLFIYLFTGF